MNTVLAPFWIALQFLTRLPTPALEPTPKDLGRSLLAYPLVGLILGAILVLAGLLLAAIPGAPVWLIAALLLALWVGLTGALHLDGLADTVDAWVGSHGDPARALQIMKDPASGPMAVVAIGLVLLLKFAALVALVNAAQWASMLAAVVLGRSALVVLFLWVPYVRAQGLGADMARHLPRRGASGVVALAVLLLLVLGSVAQIGGLLVALLVVAGGVMALVRLFRRWLGGFTGDTAGATLELTETGAIVVMALLSGL